jgi:cytosine/adenosine deaminase-related metal-dependent hydrolase
MRKRETGEKPTTYKEDPEPPDQVSASRREFLAASAAGLAAVAAGPGVPTSTAFASSGKEIVRNLEPKRKLLKGGIVLTLEPSGDFEKADVLIEDKKIVAIGPNLGGGGQRIDCSGTIVMPGFITTHHHQYETPARSVIPDGLLQGAWPQESYGSVVQNIWTAGRITGVWDLGRPPMDPEDVYLAELVASLSQLTEGITCGVDTSQSSHTPQHTDAMIQGLMDSGARAVYDYSGGTNRSAEDPNQPFEYPGAIGNNTSGIGRLAVQYFSSKDQLVTLAHAGGPGAAFPGAPYTGWQLARHFGASINNHNVGSPATVINAAADPRNNERDWSDVTLVHCVRWNDAPLAQHSYRPHGYPNPNTSTAWQIFYDKGGHASIANIIEMQMRHGMPPFQMALNYGILPSLSPDVDTNMTTDAFSLMRGAFCLQRALANDLAFASSNPGALPIPQLVTARQCIEMATIAGAASAQLLDKVGTLKVGKEADIVVLDARNINITPMNNVPGTIVTMMNPRHVRDVFVAGKTVYTNGKLVGWNMEKLLRDLEKSHQRILARIRGTPKSGALPPGNNSSGGSAYRPNFLGSCCYNGQNTTAPHYTLRP